MTAGRSEPVRLGPGELLAALCDLAPGRAADAYAALGYPVVPDARTRAWRRLHLPGRPWLWGPG
jgi:hypothetical protein